MSFFSFFYNDFKKDILFLKKFFFGTKEEKRIIINRVKFMFSMDKFSLSSSLKENWTWIMIIILALFTGMLLASVYYEISFNDRINDLNEELQENYGIYLVNGTPSINVSPQCNEYEDYKHSKNNLST